MVLNKLKDQFGYADPPLCPSLMSLDSLLLVHTADYLESLKDDRVWQEIFELKPEEYNPAAAVHRLNELLDDIRLKCGGTLLAVETALKTGLSANLGGGYHHAFPDRGRGFCVLHDIAAAIRCVQRSGLCQKVLIVDLDFHQGDGSAVIFKNDPDVFTLSVHSDEGWPDEKQESSLDVAIKSSEVHLYQQKTEEAIRFALANFSPQLVVYVAGSDPYALDVLPGTSFIKLTLEELRRRDEYVIDTFADRSIPLAMVFAGGYGPHVWEVHYQAVRRLLQRAGKLSETSSAAPKSN